MPYTVVIPEKLAKAIRSTGFDVEAFVIDAVEKALSLDPHEEIEARLEVAEYMLRRGLEELERGDPVQASEKLYKAVGEAIKALACIEGLEERRLAREEGRW